MADFVGLLKKTIEAQSQMSPRLRQRIYERARATVERKLAESHAPEPLIERQFEILNRAIDEVEAYYQKHDERSESAATNLDERAEPSPENMKEVADTPALHEGGATGGMEQNPAHSEQPVQEHAFSQSALASSESEPLIISNIETPPPFEEAFEREEAQQQQEQDAPLYITPIQEREVPEHQDQERPAQNQDEESSLVKSKEHSLSPDRPPFIEEPLESLVQPSSQSSHESEEVRHAIPSLATLLNAENTAPTQDSSPLPPDLPFLPDEPALEEQPDPLLTSSGAETVSPAFTSPSMAAAPAHSDIVPLDDGPGINTEPSEPATYPFADELLAQLPLADPVDALQPATTLSQEEQDPSHANLPAEDASLKSSTLGNYLPHWMEDEDKIHASSDEDRHVDTLDLSSLPPFPINQQAESPASMPARERVESEIDRARREIEALRTGETLIDEPPFLSDLPVEPTPVADALASPSFSAETKSEADFNNDLVSEIFVQAAKREQKQSSKKQRVAAFVIGTIVLAVLAAIIGVLIMTNEYQITGDPETTLSTENQILPSGNGRGQGNDLANAALPSDTLPPKITRRLLPDGQETDPGPAMEATTVGEGSSQTNASLPIIDNSARVVFYEDRTEFLSATASEGRVDWSLRRTPAPANGADNLSAQSAPQELAIVGDVRIPALDMTLRLTLRRNNDETVPADYLTEIIFVLPDDFEGGVIDEVGPLLFKASEQSIGQELAGTVTAKVRDNLFLMAVRAPPPVLDRNLALMRQLPWLKLNVLYKNGRVGEFSIAKGEGGNRLFQQAIDEWQGQVNARAPASPTETQTEAPVMQAPSIRVDEGAPSSTTEPDSSSPDTESDNPNIEN